MTHPIKITRADDEISLGETLRHALRFQLDFARLLIPLAVLAAIAAGLYVQARPLYQAHAILDAPKLTLDEWRRLAAVLPDPRLVAGTLAGRDGDTEAEQNRERLRRVFERPGFWTGSLQYRSALRRDDMRDAPGSDPKMASTLGLEIDFRAPSKPAAQDQMDAIARHVGQSLMWSQLDGYLRDQTGLTATQRPTFELKLNKLEFDLQQNQVRTADMRRVMEAFPERAETAGSTIITPENGGGRYLSPFAQLVALESKASELQADIRAVRRDLDRLNWSARFLAGAGKGSSDIRSGFVLADWLDQQKTKVFDAAANSSAAVQVQQELALAIAEARMRADRIVFTAAPVINDRPILARSPLLIAGATFVVVLIGLSLLLALYRMLRTLRRPSGEIWLASRDPLFAWLPARLRGALFPHEALRGPDGVRN